MHSRHLSARLRFLISAMIGIVTGWSCFAAAMPKPSAYVVYTDGTIGQYSILANGGLLGLPSVIARVGNFPTRMVVSPSARYAYISDSTWVVRCLGIGDDGALTGVSNVHLPSKKLPSDVALDPSGRYLYVSLNALTQDGGGEVCQFRVDPDGQLSPLNPPSVKAGSATYRLALHPSGKLLYAANRCDGTISEFAVTAGGTLEPLDPGVVTGCGFLGDIALSPDGRALYATDERSQRVIQFQVEAGGQLSWVSSGGFAHEDDAVGDGTAIDLSQLPNWVGVVNSAGCSLLRFRVADRKLSRSPAWSYKVTRDNTLLTRQELSALAERSPKVTAQKAAPHLDKLQLANAESVARYDLSSSPVSVVACPNGTSYLLSGSGILRLRTESGGSLTSLGSAAKWKDKLDEVDQNRAACLDNVFTGVAFPVVHGLTVVWP